VNPLVLAGGLISEIPAGSTLNHVVQGVPSVQLDHISEGQLQLDEQTLELVTRLGNQLLRYAPAVIQSRAPQLKFNEASHSNSLWIL
jgi:hypothetical protein